ncbi:phage holin family protein [Paenibacillus sp. FSL H3-0333]|uniref:phage holin family protein n=1 Tax=Paenibacillus sp. FSL H3-0333 TaxID=2921373 RepID=UPI0030FA99AC
MERVDLVIKSVVAIFAGIVSALTGLFGIIFTVLLGLMALDIITGLLAAIVTKEGWRSRKGTNGLIRKCYVILLIGSIFIVEIALGKTNGIVTDSISAAYAFMELVSIVENGGKMNAPIPKKLKEWITTLKEAVGEGDSSE